MRKSEVDNPELLLSSNLGHSQPDDTAAQITINPTCPQPESTSLIAWRSTRAHRKHPGQMGTILSAARPGRMASGCLRSSVRPEPRSDWPKYLGDDGLAVARAKHKVVYSHGRRVGGALRRALPQPGALPASCKAAESRGTHAERTEAQPVNPVQHSLEIQTQS